MTGKSIFIKKFIVPLVMVFMLVGCGFFPHFRTTHIDYSFEYEAQVDPNRERVRLLTSETAMQMVRHDAFMLPKDEKTDIVELVNRRFTMLVYLEDSYLGMSLIIPAGEELFIDEPWVKVINKTSQQEILKTETEWLTSWKLSSDQEALPERLIGLATSPPATNYWAEESIFFSEITTDEMRMAGGEPIEIEVVIQLPAFKNKNNDAIRFEDVTFKLSAFAVYYYEGRLL